ncbi:hypothetical protein KEM56_002302 [Ascosphaera pollenicola]|nr:hypothetical protein KEM56_002302 [Ascosphaera pollenicola]
MVVNNNNFVVLGGGVAGLTTAYELSSRVPGSKITVVAKHFPGDVNFKEYCSPQAGANWVSFENEYNRLAKYDETTFKRFQSIIRDSPESGVKSVPLRLVFGKETPKSARPWYSDLLGLQEVPQKELPEDAGWGLEGQSLIINTAVYLSWLQGHLIRAEVSFVRKHYDHVDTLFADFPNATALFNCTGLGAKTLGGVNDAAVFPAKGQTILVADPKEPIVTTYFWKQEPMEPWEFSHVFPRPLGGGIIIGGIKVDGEWSDAIDQKRIEIIRERACQLCPQLGKPDELQIIRHNVGLRPGREGGTRVEAEQRGDRTIVHNYGAGGAGYQSSWGTAQLAVDLLLQQSGVKSKL